MEDKNLDVKLALEEMRLNLQASFSAGDILDQKVNTILTASGLVLAVTTTLQILLSSNRSDLYWLILLTAIGLYILSICVLIISSRPQKYHLAISAEWEELDQNIFGRSEREAILTLLSGYIDQIHYNEEINRRKARMHGGSLVILGLVVILFPILVVIQ